MRRKLELGNNTLFFAECPDCGADRTFNKEKAGIIGGLTGAGILTGLIFGAPLFGVLGIFGVVKLAAGGVIAGPAAARIIRENYKLLEKASEVCLFDCPDCHCHDILR